MRYFRNDYAYRVEPPVLGTGQTLRLGAGAGYATTDERKIAALETLADVVEVDKATYDALPAALRFPVSGEPEPGDASIATDAELASAAGPPIPSLEAYGHSLINDAGAAAARYGFVSRIGALMGAPAAKITKTALSGGKVADQIVSGGVSGMLTNMIARDLSAGPYVTRGGLKLCSIAANDHDPMNPQGAAGSAVVEGALRLAYSGMLSARVIGALSDASTLNADLVYSSGWSVLADTTICMAPGEAYHSTSGAYVEFTLDDFYDGEAITAMIVVAGATQFTATLSVAGQDQASVDTTAMQTALAAAVALGGSGGSPFALRIPAGVASAGETVRLTMTGMSGGKLATFNGFLIEGHDPPPLLLPSIPVHPADSTQNTNAAYQKARVAAVAPEFPSAVVIDQDDLLPDEAAWSVAVTGHPNSLGYERIAAALYPTARELVTPAVAARMNA